MNDRCLASYAILGIYYKCLGHLSFILCFYAPLIPTRRLIAKRCCTMSCNVNIVFLLKRELVSRLALIILAGIKESIYSFKVWLVWLPWNRLHNTFENFILFMPCITLVSFGSMTFMWIFQIKWYHQCHFNLFLSNETKWVSNEF
jgi:hypothetical protein